MDGLFAFLTPGLQTRSTVVKPSEARNAVVLAAQAPRAAFHHGLAAARADDARHDAGAGGCGIGDLLDAEDLLEGRIENALDHFGVKALVAGLLLGRHRSAREGEGLEDTGFLGLASGHEAGDVDEADGAVVASTPEGEGHLAVVAMDEVALAEGAADERADIDEEIDFIFHRAGLLRNGELCVVLSAVVTGLMVALCVLEESTGVHADFVNSMLLVAAVGLIVLSTVFLSLEIRLSLKAIKVVVSKLPPVTRPLTMRLRQGPLRPWRRGTSPICSTKRDTLRKEGGRTRSGRLRRSVERQETFFLSCHCFAFVDIIN